jgi:hypothetical protein
MWWIGMVLSALPLPMLLMGVVMVFANPEMIREGMREHGFPEGVAVPLIVVEFVCAILYIIPQTAVLGAILLTGYLGGAVATHVHAAEFGQTAVPVLIGVILWLGLYFRDARIRAVVPWRR